MKNPTQDANVAHNTTTTGTKAAQLEKLCCDTCCRNNEKSVEQRMLKQIKENWEKIFSHKDMVKCKMHTISQADI